MTEPISTEQVGVSLKEGEQPPKTKAQLKAERRAIQEAQRAAKQKLKEQQAQGGGAGKQKQPPTGAKPAATKSAAIATKPSAKGKPADVSKPTTKQPDKQPDSCGSGRVEILSHLKLYDRNIPPTQALSYTSSKIHPAFVKLGVQMARDIIVGSNARCAALICAVKTFIEDYNCPKTKEIRSHLNIALKPCFSYLAQCRMMSVSMENFIKHIKLQITKTSPDLSDNEAKEELLFECENFFKENIYLAGKSISEKAVARIVNGDMILIYKKSQLILHILLEAKRQRKQFKVMVVDSRPDLTGVASCERLTAAGIPCSYVYINSCTYIMKKVTKVLLASDALLANGYVLGPVGTAMIGLIASNYNTPVIVCCETYKFSERVQTDSILYNELADPDSMLKTLNADDSLVAGWRESPNTRLVNLVYDTTPPALVSIVITEIAELPCTSAPVVLRRGAVKL